MSPPTYTLSRAGQTHRLLLVLKHLLDLLVAADLLDALPLDGALPDLLQEAIGSGKAFQERVGIPGPQEHCNTQGTDILSRDSPKPLPSQAFQPSFLMPHASPRPRTQGYSQVGQQVGQPRGHRALVAPGVRAEVLETSETAAAATQGN